ncbi:LysM peptidoglycan-binding domain-containing protein, partial [Acinetobacter baumannii]
ATKSYTVKRGEYLKLIADRYALSNQELAELTPGLSAGSNLMAGQKINVPTQDISVDEVAETKTSSKSEKAAASISYKTEGYKVQRGDTLSSI